MVLTVDRREGSHFADLGYDKRLHDDRRYLRVLSALEKLYGPAISDGWSGVAENFNRVRRKIPFSGVRQVVFNSEGTALVVNGHYEFMFPGGPDLECVSLSVAGTCPEREKVRMASLLKLVECELAADLAEHGL